MDDFKSTRADMETLKLTLEQIQINLDATYQKAVELKGMMSDVDFWDGEAHQVGMAFMDLTAQYHGQLAGPETGPVQQAVAALDKFLETEDEFYTNWEKYQELSKI